MATIPASIPAMVLTTDAPPVTDASNTPSATAVAIIDDRSICNTLMKATTPCTICPAMKMVPRLTARFRTLPMMLSKFVAKDCCRSRTNCGIICNPAMMPASVEMSASPMDLVSNIFINPSVNLSKTPLLDRLFSALANVWTMGTTYFNMTVPIFIMAMFHASLNDAKPAPAPDAISLDS